MTGLVDGKIVLITGATSGIGEMTALYLASQGAHVIIHGRSEGSCQAAILRIRSKISEASLDFLAADLSSLEQVKKIARLFQERYNHLDVLINNAGGFFLRRQTSQDNLEMTMAVNHLAHFVLTLMLIPQIKESPSARIINVASNAHLSWVQLKPGKFEMPRKYSSFGAYGDSKLANILFTYELTNWLAETKITVNALHPGFVATRIGMNNGFLVSMVMKLQQKSKVLKQRTTEEGAETSIYLASSPEVEGVTGKYFIDCKEVPSSPLSYDKQLAKSLWEWSVQVTGIDFPGK
jgi:NAD(P)-dependent dehydrogenase (short-subunit alcohol dehydrogenase family)